MQVVEFGQRAQLASLDGASAASRRRHRPGGRLAAGRSLLPGNGARSVVVLTDGQETQGRAAAPDWSGRRVRLVRRAAGADAPEVALRAADVAPVVRAGDYLDLNLVVESTVQENASLRVSLDGQVVSHSRSR